MLIVCVAAPPSDHDRKLYVVPPMVWRRRRPDRPLEADDAGDTVPRRVRLAVHRDLPPGRAGRDRERGDVRGHVERPRRRQAGRVAHGQRDAVGHVGQRVRAGRGGRERAARLAAEGRHERPHHRVADAMLVM